MKVHILVAVFAFCLIAASADGQTIVNSWPTGSPFPGGLDYDSGTDTVWVADSNADTIYQFDRNGVLLTSFAAPLTMAIGVAADPATGNVWIGDESEWVDEVTPTGALTGRSWPTTPYITDVSGLALDPVTGHIFISQDSGTQQVAEFDQNGAFIQTIIVTGAGSIDPDGLAYNPATQTFLLGEDTGDQIIEVDMTGTLVNSWALGGLAISPEGLGVDVTAGTVFIADGFGGMVWEVAGIIDPYSPGFNLSIDQLVGGQKTTFTMSGADPGDHILLASSKTGGGPIYSPFGQILLTCPLCILTKVQADSTGTATYTMYIPNAPGKDVWFQALNWTGRELSNGLAETIQ